MKTTTTRRSSSPKPALWLRLVTPACVIVGIGLVLLGYLVGFVFILAGIAVSVARRMAR